MTKWNNTYEVLSGWHKILVNAQYMLDIIYKRKKREWVSMIHNSFKSCIFSFLVLTSSLGENTQCGTKFLKINHT